MIVVIDEDANWYTVQPTANPETAWGILKLIVAVA
jgi:hypothetical protein